MNRLVRAAPVAGAAVAAAIGLAHAWWALGSGHGVDHVSGVWLTLARDAQEGTFYRALIGSGLYGGTRYFPLFFELIAALLSAGLRPIAAGHVASLAGAGILAAGAFRFLTALGLEKRQALVGAVLALAPYFVQQSVFAIRTEPLAAGLGLLGASFVARRQREAAPARWAWLAALCFGLAVAAKPTAGYAGIAAVAALAWSRRYQDAGRLLVCCAVCWSSVMLAIAVLSDGRAIESFRACALAGGTLEVLRPSALLLALGRATSSRLLSAVILLAAAALASSPGRRAELPAWLLAGAIVALSVTMSTAGTILTNQGVEPYVAAVLCIVWIGGSVRSLRIAGVLVTTGLLVWTSAQNVREIRHLVEADVRRSLPAARSALIERAGTCQGTLLAESPLVPILTGRPAVLLDPFAFRVAAAKHPGLTSDLGGRLARREFGCVILDRDPGTAAGRGWYANVHLGSAVIDAVLANYRLGEIAGGYRFYVPGRPGGA